MPETTTIYSLSDPDTGEVRYVGKTSVPAEQRLREHLRTRKRGTHRTHWIQSLVATGKQPTLRVIEVVDGDGAAEECRWIQHYRSAGARLTNHSSGGEGGSLGGSVTRPCGFCGASVTRKAAEFKQSKSGELFCNARCAAGYNASPARVSLSCAYCGAEVIRQRCEIAKYQRRHGRTGLTFCNNACSGAHASVNGLRRRSKTDEEKARTSAFHRGRKRSEETRQRMSEAQRRCWAERRGPNSLPIVTNNPCGWCGAVVERYWQQVEKSLSGFVFCNTTCAARYRASARKAA